MSARSQPTESADRPVYNVVVCTSCAAEFRVRTDRSIGPVRCPHCQAADCLAPPPAESTENPAVVSGDAAAANIPSPPRRARGRKHHQSVKNSNIDSPDVVPPVRTVKRVTAATGPGTKPHDPLASMGEPDVRCTVEEVLVLRARLTTEASNPEASPDEAETLAAVSYSSLHRWLNASVNEKKILFGQFEANELRRLRCDERQISFDRKSISKIATQAYRNRIRIPLAAFCLAPVPMPSDRFQISTVPAIANLYRLSDCLPETPDEELQQALSQFGRASSPASIGVGLGMETLFTSASIVKFLRRHHPLKLKTRLAHELFWFQLSSDWSAVLHEVGSAASNLLLALLHDLEPKCGARHAALVRHAISVVWLNAALARETAFALGKTTAAVGYWDMALQSWSETIDDDLFWESFRSRVQSRGQPADAVDTLREELPLFLVCLVCRFAQAYGQAGENVSFHRLVATLHRSQFPAEVVEPVTCAMVRSSYY